MKMYQLWWTAGPSSCQLQMSCDDVPYTLKMKKKTYFGPVCFTLKSKRNAKWFSQHLLNLRVKVTWKSFGLTINDQMCPQVFLTGCKRSHSKISNGSLAILKSPYACHKTKIIKRLKSHCDKCKFGTFFKHCVFLGQDVHNIESLGIFYFGRGPSNILSQTPYQDIK